MPASEAQKKATKKYLDGLDEIRIRAPKGTKERWKDAASICGKSMNQAVVDAVEAALMGPAAGDRPEGHQEPQEGHEPAGGVILSGEALEVALKAAQATQESVEEFIERAISTQATRDEKARSMGIKP